MKRSEMVDIITDVLYNTDKKDLDYTKDAPYSEKVLEAIEEAGMLPPPESIEGPWRYDFKLGTRLVLHYGPQSETHQSYWELEEE